MLKRLLTKAENEVTRLRRSLAKAKERDSLFEHRASKATTKVVETFKKGEVFHQKLLKSNQDACAKGA